MSSYLYIPATPSCWGHITRLSIGNRRSTSLGEASRWFARLLDTNEPVYEQPFFKLHRTAYAAQHMVLELACLSCKSLQMKLGTYNWGSRFSFPFSVCTAFSTKSLVSSERLSGSTERAMSCADLWQQIQVQVRYRRFKSHLPEVPRSSLLTVLIRISKHRSS